MGSPWLDFWAKCGLHFHPDLHCELRRRDVPKCGKGSASVVVLLPGGDLGAGFGQRREQHFVKELVAKSSFEARYEVVLYGFAGCDAVPVDCRALAPGQDRGRGELSAIGAEDGHGAPPSGDDCVQFTHDPRAQQGGIGGHR